jgi:phosphoglycolate phosphatase-like HAD superfamily hydrolase
MAAGGGSRPGATRRGANTMSVEIIRQLPPGLHIRHAVFDHDGTITTLRQGWEAIMEPVMVRAILGPDGRSEEERERVTGEVRRLIEETTGIQTLVQMRSLVEMVRDFGFVAERDTLDEHGYKAIYKAELDTMVESRVAHLRTGERSLDEVLVPGVLDFLRELRERGVRLYLCSGTDVEDVARDADLLGIAGHFDGGIHGAVGDIHTEAKRIVLDRIMREIGGAGQVVTFGDGPVETRETRARGGVAVGLATDETSLGRLNPIKRERLIRAGADLIIPDFTGTEGLLSLLGCGRS